MNHLTPNDKCSMCEPFKIVCSMNFSVNWNPLKGLMQSHLLNYTSVIKFKCATPKVCCLHTWNFSNEPGTIGQHNWSDSFNINERGKKKNTSIPKAQHFVGGSGTGNAYASQSTCRVLSPHSINLRSEKYDYYLFHRQTLIWAKHSKIQMKYSIVVCRKIDE